MSRSPERAVLEAVERLRRRATLVSFTRHGVRSLFYCLVLCALAAIVVPGVYLAPLMAVIVTVSVTVAAVFAVLGQPTDVALAKAYDDHMGLKDRLSTSVALLGSGGAMLPALLEDTVRTAGPVHPERVFPFQLPRETWFLPVPILLAVGILVLPGVLEPVQARDQKLDETLETAASRIADFVAREEGRESTPGRRQVMAKLEKVAAELTRKKYAKKDALSELNKLMEELKEDKSKDEEKQQELKKKLKNFQTNEKSRELADEINKGNYQDAANRIKKLLEELKRKKKKLQKQKKPTKKALEELKKLDKRMKHLQDLEAKLLRLMMLRAQINMRGDVLDFLRKVEGDLAELEDPDVKDRKWQRFGKLNPNGKNGKKGQVFRFKRRLIKKPQKGAGVGTMDEFLDKKEQRDRNDRKEHKQKIREGKKGQVSVTQTQVANDGSRSQLKAKEVLQAEKRAAEDTIHRQDVPAGYREYLRRYFEGIQPDEGRKRRRR